MIIQFRDKDAKDNYYLLKSFTIHKGTQFPIALESHYTLELLLVDGNPEEHHLGEFFEKLGIKRAVEGRMSKTQTSSKRAKRGEMSSTQRKRKGVKNLIIGLSTMVGSSQRQRVLLVKKDLQKGSIQRYDVWKYMSGITK